VSLKLSKYFGLKLLTHFVSNPYCLFGFLWGLPIPLLVLGLHFYLTDRPFQIDSCIPILSEFPLYWIFILHPILFAIAFGIVGVILQRKDKKIRELIQRLQNESITDPLTQLFNRRRITRIMQREMMRTQKNHLPFSVIMIDIDNFKSVNDTYGHLVGDHALCAVSQILESVLRPHDSVGRWGGEEFILLLPDTTVEQALLVSERIRHLISTQSITSDESSFYLYVSAGISQIQDNDTIETVIHRVDIALYKAKEKGKNKSEIYKKE